MMADNIRSLARVAGVIVLVSILGACASGPPPVPAVGEDRAQSPFPGTEWARATPESAGLSRDRIERAVAYAQGAGSTAGMIVRHGLVVAEWGDVARRSNLHSVRKSLMSALVGNAAARGQIDLDRTLEQLGIDDNAPSLAPAEKQATVRMLLAARSGVYHPTVYETAGMTASKPPRYSHAPGTFWYYNNWDFNTVGAIYEKATGQRIFDALEAEIAIPIGMQDYRPSDGHYVSGGRATRYPAYPLDMSARDLARFALLYLHNGRWRDRQVVPADWVAESTKPYSDTPFGGYGYMWWTSTPASGPRAPAASRLPTAYWAAGSHGQYAVVVPSLDLVVVNLVDVRLTSRNMLTRNMEELVRLIESAAGQTGVGQGPQPG